MSIKRKKIIFLFVWRVSHLSFLCVTFPSLKDNYDNKVAIKVRVLSTERVEIVMIFVSKC